MFWSVLRLIFEYRNHMHVQIDLIVFHVFLGVPDYNVPSIEPLPLKNFSFSTIGIQFTSEDAKLYGLSKFYVNKFRWVFSTFTTIHNSYFFRADISDKYMDLDIEIPHLKIISNYSIFGKFLILDINEIDEMETNLGRVHINNIFSDYSHILCFVLADCSIKSQFKSELVIINEVKHINLTECNSRIKCRKGSVDLGDFFGGRESVLSKYCN